MSGHEEGAAQPPAPEFSRPFRLEKLGNAPVTESLRARPEERAALAARLDLLALDRLEAELTLSWRAAGTLLEVSGSFSAEVVQRCVVTLEPVPARIEEAVHLQFTAASSKAAGPEEEPTDPDAPEPLPPEGLDLGEEVAQLLSLALDPYPRAPGADLPPEATDETGSPFAELKALKKGKT